MMQTNYSDSNSLGYSSADVESESYLHNGDDGGSLATAQMLNDPNNSQYRNHNRNNEHDATSVVHEMHLALLYLLSNPDEFRRALAARPSQGATTLHEWNAEYDETESLAETTATDSHSVPDTSMNNRTTPLPFVVFADDAEVVLPAAHTASQLFGLEKVTGMELEAAAGLPALSQLFLRWLALMPGGDHLNIIDPPGLTVMRIAGGRYRVTAAHRVIWTWQNLHPYMVADGNYGDSYIDNDGDDDSYGGGNMGSSRNSFNNDEAQLQPNDLVSLTIVDVFETDNQGKLLSYCPTFDNRDVVKTNAPTETFRKSSAHLAKLIGKAQKSTLAKKISYHAVHIAQALKERVEEAVAANTGSSPVSGNNSKKARSPLSGSRRLDLLEEKKESSLHTPQRRKSSRNAYSQSADDAHTHEI